MRRMLMGAMGIGLMVGAAACSASSKDFQKEAAKFIESKKVEDAVGKKFTDATCEKPADTKKGTKFQCTAKGDDGNSYVFDVEITGEREFTLQDVNQK